MSTRLPITNLFQVSAVKVAVIYAVFGGLWIFFSDQLVLTIADSQQTVTQLQTIKGWGFIAVSSGVIYGLVRFQEAQMAGVAGRLKRTVEQLQVFGRIHRHNLRNDINTVTGYIELAQEQIQNDQILADLDRAKDRAMTLLAIAQKLQTLDKISSDPANDIRVDLANIVELECERFAREHPAISLQTSLPTHAVIMGEPVLGDLVRELLDNATRHQTGPPDELRIEVEIDHGPRQTALRVRDNGQGIPPHELIPLRAGEETPLVHTSGIGLWFVQWLAEIYDGQLSVETGGDGTTITVEFPSLPSLERAAVELEASLPRLTLSEANRRTFSFQD